MRCFSSGMILALSALLLVLGASVAQTPATSFVQRMHLSAQLFSFGTQEGDPLAIISAASIRKSTGFWKGRVGNPDQDWSGDNQPVGWQDMLNVASGLAGDRDDLQALIEDVRQETSRGLLTGAIISKAELEPGAKRHYQDMIFEGGAYAEVYSEARQDLDIDLHIYDDTGQLICSRVDSGPVSLCGWTPTSTAPFTIIVENKTDQAVGYLLITN